MSQSSILMFATLGVIFGFIFFSIGYWIRKATAERKVGSAEQKAREILLEAKQDAKEEGLKRLQAVEKSISKLKRESDEAEQIRAHEYEARIQELALQEETLNAKKSEIAKREKEALELNTHLKKDRGLLISSKDELSRIINTEREILQRLSGLSAEDAKRQLLKRMEVDIRSDASRLIKTVEAEAKTMSERKALKILSLAMQRCAAEHSIESTVSVVNLPSEEMKGRIIGKEGRNIRTFESVTGVDLVIDDTPGAVILSAFDMVRREIARIALERLIEDGRIHPSSIEEMVGVVRQEMDQKIREEGEKTILELGVGEMHPELIRLVGRLRYRTSYGQNVLLHSKEVANFMNVIAGEMGLDPIVCKRAGLLHDIGKAVSHEVEGPHALIGGELVRRYGESQEVVHGVEAHHGDIEAKSELPILVQAADAMSGARPGARRESLENYLKRLRKLEKTASTIPGVERVYAIQAGREIRVIVHPDQVGDKEMPALAREISKKVEQDLQFPGQIKVTVIRETRATEFAK